MLFYFIFLCCPICTHHDPQIIFSCVLHLTDVLVGKMEEIEIILIVIIVVLVLIALIVMMIKCIEASRKGEEVSNVSLLSFYLVPNQPQTCLHSIYDYGV